MSSQRFTSAYFVGYDERGKETFPYLKRLVRTLPKGAKVLDVGCGKGTFLAIVHGERPDIETHGVDIGEVEGLIPSFVRFRKASGDHLPYRDGTFDLVTCQHVLEHVHNPQEFMLEYFRVLKPGGICYVEAPYYKTAYIPEGNMNFWSDPTHVRPHSRISMARLFSKNGFQEVEVRVWRSWVSIAIAPWLLLKRLFGDRDALSTLCAHLKGNTVSGRGRKAKREPRKGKKSI